MESESNITDSIYYEVPVPELTEDDKLDAYEAYRNESGETREPEETRLHERSARLEKEQGLEPGSLAPHPVTPRIKWWRDFLGV